MSPTVVEHLVVQYATRSLVTHGALERSVSHVRRGNVFTVSHGWHYARGSVFIRVQLFPDRRSILKWVKDFREHGNVATKTPARRPSVVTPENLERVRASVEESPRRSTRRRARALGISRRSLRTILHKHLNFHSYKITIVQKLLPRVTTFNVNNYVCACWTFYRTNMHWTMTSRCFTYNFFFFIFNKTSLNLQQLAFFSRLYLEN